ncbi:MAG TPA: radical SAM protein [Xanthomonadales bacterium]|nr:radical SAM protein [Xanthomonadales bacterium]
MVSGTEFMHDSDANVRSGFLPDRIIHLHPTVRCNLACLHCYSESDPQQGKGLDADEICHALQVLRSEGYAVISLSGGEPLVYQPLGQVIEFAKSIGFRVTMISNGLLATRKRDDVLDLLDGIALSFDGMAATHNHMRGRPDAFERSCAALQRLAERGVTVAAAISLARDSIPELPELADHLVSMGARALQIRPVARAGRARSLAENSFYNAADRARLYLVVLALQQELPEDIRVHCDLAPAQGLWQQREAYAGLLASCAGGNREDLPLAELVNPLVITDTGTLKPIAYDFASCFDVAEVQGLSTEQLSSYKDNGLSALKALIGSAVAGLQDSHELIDWFDFCTRLSERNQNPDLQMILANVGQI